MNPGWRVLDFTGFAGAVGYSRGALTVRREGSETKEAIPLANIAVILVGTKVGISGAVLSKIGEYDISLVVCNWAGIPIAGAMPWSSHSRVGARQLAQSKLSLPRQKNAWSKLVSAKVRAQAECLRVLKRPGQDHLTSLSRAVRSGDPNNVEAIAARFYWQRLVDLDHFVRSPGSGDGGINSALDYGYTVLRGHAIRAVVSAGLSGTIGVYHRGRSNPFALADDLIEPFRPVVDLATALNWKKSGELSTELKQSLVMAVTEEPFLDSGATTPTSMVDLAQKFGAYVEGRAKTLDIPVWKPNYA